MRSAAALAWVLAATAAAAAPAPVAHYHGSASLDPDLNALRAKFEITLQEAPREGQPWRFLLHRELRVRGAFADGRPLLVQELDGWDPRHFWERPPYAELADYDVAREIELGPPTGGWGEEPPRLTMQWSGTVADSLHPPEQAYGRSFETTSGRIVREGAFLSGASFWIPWAGPGSFTFQVAVEAPLEWSSIAPGDFEGRQESDATATMHWASRDPVEEIHIVSGPYVVQRREHRGVSLETWCYASTPPEVSEPYLDAAAGAIDRFSERFGPYPYSKCALVENYWQTGWGMPSFTLLGDRVIRLPFIPYTSFPHEILHNWWGNGVFVDYEKGNWCEGLTTYGADYATKEREGGDAAREYRRNQLVGYRDFAKEGGRDFPLSRFRARDSAATQAVGYGKTLMVLHMLHRRVGPDVFDGALKRFYRENLFSAAGWSDLRAAFEAQSGEDLAAWFEQWVERPGAPALTLENVTVSGAGGRRVVSGTVVQDGDWSLQVPMVALRGDEREDIVVSVDGPRAEFEFEVAFDPETIAADPEFHLFRLLHAEEVAPTLSGVLGAAETRIVIGAGASGELRSALLALGREWAADDGVTVVEETAGQPLPAFDGGTWFFGAGEAMLTLVDDLPELELEGSRVIAGRLGGPEGTPAAALLPLDAGSVPALGRKIPHYSKYSWLVFEGTKNVGKGTWDAGESPLTVQIGGES